VNIVETLSKLGILASGKRNILKYLCFEISFIDTVKDSYVIIKAGFGYTITSVSRAELI